MLDVFRSAWAKAAEGDVPLQADEDDDPGVMVDKGVSHAPRLLRTCSQVEATSGCGRGARLAITLRDVDSGEPLEERLVGTIDLLIRERERLVIIEHKTSSRRTARINCGTSIQRPRTSSQLESPASAKSDSGSRSF